MSPILVSALILGYFLVLILIGRITSRRADNQSFFLGNKRSPWYIVAFGMIGASLSGVTFISVPGWVGSSQFSYMQMILGFLPGYFIIAHVLMPVYYRLNLTTIYTYLDNRFGVNSYKTGASFFMLSRITGSAMRLYLVAVVLDTTVFSKWGVPFIATVAVTILLIWLYTYKGGIKTIIWTDTLQTICMLAAVVLTIYLIGRKMGLDPAGIVTSIRNSELSQVWVFDDWGKPYHFVKQFLGGAFTAIVMTGLDQDMMQKNLSCRNITDAKKNMFWMSLSLVPVNLLFLSLGALLYLFAAHINLELPGEPDNLYPLIATGGYISPLVGVLFVLGVIAAAYSSADSALTALTTSFTVDILGAQNRSENELKKTRLRVHIGISIVLGIVILIFKMINNSNVITAIYTIAGYTYGPLLGLFAFGLSTKRMPVDRWIPWLAILSPVITFIINRYSEVIFRGYKFGFELLLVNGLIMYTGMWILSIKRTHTPVINQ
jgi:Na+/proline symporter